MLQNTTSGPNDIHFHIARSDSFFITFPYNVTLLDLGEFEDLYYAACAKIKDFLHRANILLDNGFKNSQDNYFEYACLPLSALGPIKLGNFKACLLAQQKLLQGEQLVKLLDEGVTRKSMRANRQQYGAMSMNDSCAQQIQQFHESLGQNTGGADGANSNSRHRSFQQGSKGPGEIDRLADITNMSSGMIFAQLAEKHRNVAVKSRQVQIPPTSSTAEQGSFEANYVPKYISPYNLDERAKKLRAPGGPAMPCICDPDCMCVPLCASDPTRNCLCEENGLFVRVTEGMDIDDLDVPDLVRRKRQSSASGSSSSSSSSSKTSVALSPTESAPTWDEVISAWEIAVKSLDHRDATLDEIQGQQIEQKAQATEDVNAPNMLQFSTNQFNDILSSGAFYTLPTLHNQTRYRGNFQITPPRNSSLAYREALVRPFAKECATPPKRPSTRYSVARRLFSTSAPFKPAEKGPSAVVHSFESVSANSGRIAKLGRKRALAEVTLPSLKRTFRQVSHK